MTSHYEITTDVGIFHTFQLCITVNNIEHVRRALLPLPVQLEFSIIQAAYERSNVNRNTSMDKISLMDTLKEANDSIVEKLNQVVDRVACKVHCSSFPSFFISFLLSHYPFFFLAFIVPAYFTVTSTCQFLSFQLGEMLIS